MKRSFKKSFLILFPFYLLFLPFTFFGFAWLWRNGVAGKLYYCSDPFPIIEFIPPFVHQAAADYYIASPFVVYFVWLGFMMAVFLLPAVILGLTNKFFGKK